MRVVIDARMINHTGIGRYIQNLICHLPAGRDSYCAISGLDLAGLREGGDFTFRKPVPAIPVYSLREQFLLPIEVKRLKPDIVHYPSFNMPAFNTGPSVVTIHDLIYYLYPEACPGKAAFLYAKILLSMVVKAANRVIAVSHHVKGQIVRHLGVHEGKVGVIYGGIDHKLYMPVNDCKRLEKVRARYRLDNEYILYVGSHQPRKNIRRLLSAYYGSDAMKEHDLVLTGRIDGRRADLYSSPMESGIGERVRFLGEVPEEDLPALYSMAALFVFPSLNEGFGLPPLEAMACGTPVVTSNTTALPEVAGDAAVMVDPTDAGQIRDAIDTVLGSRALREELREKGLIRAGQFSWETTAKKTMQVYREVLSR